MATMNRNVDLEEINTDAFMGIPYLQYQSGKQKIIFWGCMLVAIVINLVINFFIPLNVAVTIFLMLVPMLIGIAFGCNYNEDLSLIKYFVLLISKPSKAYVSKPTEDVEVLRKSSERIRQEVELKQRQQQMQTPEEHRKMLYKVLISMVVGIILLIVIVVFILSNKTEEIHHTVSVINYIETGIDL